jgi:transcriptional regulator with XRE-family HTH domain
MLRKKGLIDQPRSLGQHLRNRRLILGLHQEDVARQLGCLREVYDRWERDERHPVVSEWPRILTFLGYYPFRNGTSADLVLRARRSHGADQKRLAEMVGVIHQRLRRWEHGKETVPVKAERLLRKLADCD